MLNKTIKKLFGIQINNMTIPKNRLGNGYFQTQRDINNTNGATH